MNLFATQILTACCVLVYAFVRVSTLAEAEETVGSLQFVVERANAKTRRDLKTVKQDNDGEERQTTQRRRTNVEHSLGELLKSLPTVSVAAKRSVEFECELSSILAKQQQQHPPSGAQQLPSDAKVAWSKLVKRGELGVKISPLSLNRRVIVADERISVAQTSGTRFSLSVARVERSLDDSTYFLCQLSSAHRDAQIVSGALLRVLEPPTIVAIAGLTGNESELLAGVEQRSSEVLLASVGEPATLRCVAQSSDDKRASIVWRREDGAQLPSSARVSVSSRQSRQASADHSSRDAVWLETSELRFPQVTSDALGAYLCIAANGVPPSVSKRVSLALRQPPTTTTTTTTTSATEQTVGDDMLPKRNWTTWLLAVNNERQQTEPKTMTSAVVAQSAAGVKSHAQNKLSNKRPNEFANQKHTGKQLSTIRQNARQQQTSNARTILQSQTISCATASIVVLMAGTTMLAVALAFV